MRYTIFFVILFAILVCQTALSAQNAPPEEGGFPEGAILLFGESPANPGVIVNRFLKKDGEKSDWRVEDGCLISTSNPEMPGNTNHVYSEDFFRDAHIHVEFQVPEKGSGNSGVYVHGNYEMQITGTSPTKAEPSMSDLGGLYLFYAPKMNAGRPRGQWQVYDIDYTAPRRDENGKITELGRITAWLNGQLVQDDVTFDEPRSQGHPFRYGKTPHLDKIYAEQQKTAVGPVFLQDHGSPVKFRNVWIKKKDD